MVDRAGNYVTVYVAKTQKPTRFKSLDSGTAGVRLSSSSCCFETTSKRVGMLLLVPAYRLYQSAVAVSISRVSIIYAHAREFWTLTWTTVTFEESVFSVGPACLLLVLLPWRFISLQRRSQKTRKSWIHGWKLVGNEWYGFLPMFLPANV